MSRFMLEGPPPWLIEGGGYDTRQNSLFYILFFSVLASRSLDRAQNPTNRNVLVT